MPQTLVSRADEVISKDAIWCGAWSALGTSVWTGRELQVGNEVGDNWSCSSVFGLLKGAITDIRSHPISFASSP